MKQKHPLAILALLLCAATVFMACSKSDNDEEEDETTNYWTQYREWRQENVNFFEEKYAETDENGNPVYERITPTWDASSTILMRWYNDRSLTADAVVPHSTSYVDVIYEGKIYDGTVFDDSFDSTTPADSIYRSKLTDNVKGWVIALTNMHVGDHCEVIIPQECGYGSKLTSEIILPYSTLVFDIKLRGVPGLDKPVN